MKGYFVHCRTGCSCCSSENHTRGPFSTLAIAEARVVSYREMQLLTSQYSRTGVYYPDSAEVEVLPDGRLIIEDQVYKGFVDTAVPGSKEEVAYT